MYFLNFNNGKTNKKGLILSLNLKLKYDIYIISNSFFKLLVYGLLSIYNFGHILAKYINAALVHNGMTLFLE